MGGLGAARKVELDAAEVRVDCLARPVGVEDLKGLAVPLIITVRREDEGGARAMTDAQRSDLYLELLPVASAVDIELRSFKALAGVVEKAKKRGVLVIGSFHDFEVTPSLGRLRAAVKAARKAGADVVKIAAKTERASEVARLLILLEEREMPTAVMGMGTLGRASRLLFAKAGSVLNYGWLHEPQVPGQWSAKEFRDLLARA
ncbi:3-dehydroquinate dehydratase [soil metagenome]